MKASELEKQLPPIARGLYNLKRCFGSNATIGIVLGPGCRTGHYRTLAELEDEGHIPPGYRHLDPYLAAVPTVYTCTTEEVELIPSRNPEGPECPWVEANRSRPAIFSRLLKSSAGPSLRTVPNSFQKPW